MVSSTSRAERKWAYSFWHRYRIRRCHKLFCLRCLMDSLTGVHRRNRKMMAKRFDEREAAVLACDHSWETVNRGGRAMPHCWKCGVTKWVRA